MTTTTPSTTFPTPGGRDNPDPLGLLAAADSGDEVSAPHSHERTARQLLRDEMANDVVVELVHWELDSRPGYVVSYRCDVSSDDFARFTKLADKKKAAQRGGGMGADAAQLDLLRFSALMLATYNVGITRRGEPMLDDDDAPMTFRSPEYLEIMGVKRAADAVVKAYGLDGLLISHGNELINASKWNSQPTETGPTGQPSTD